MSYHPILHRIKDGVNNSVVYCRFVRHANKGYTSSRIFVFNYSNISNCRTIGSYIPSAGPVKVPYQKRRNNYRIPRLNKLILFCSTEKCHLNTFCVLQTSSLCFGN